MTTKAVVNLTGGPYPHSGSTTSFDVDVHMLHLSTGNEHDMRIYDVPVAFLTTTVLASGIRDAVKDYYTTTQQDTFGFGDTVLVINATV